MIKAESAVRPGVTNKNIAAQVISVRDNGLTYFEVNTVRDERIGYGFSLID